MELKDFFRKNITNFEYIVKEKEFTVKQLEDATCDIAKMYKKSKENNSALGKLKQNNLLRHLNAYKCALICCEVNGVAKDVFVDSNAVVEFYKIMMDKKMYNGIVYNQNYIR